jgi:endonuclease V-like protein UPF0215 family
VRAIKSEIRILGFDDGPFAPKRKGKAPLIGVVYRGGTVFDGMMSAEVEVDGLDSTDVVIRKVKKSKHREQLRVIMLHGITFGGFNVLDIGKLNKETGLPVIVVCRKKPNFKDIKKALGKFPDFEKRWAVVERAGKVFELETKNNKKIYFQFIGLEKGEAEEIILLSCTRSLIPEPLRVAHMVASGLVKGESGCRA